MAISFSPRSVFFALYASVAARLDTAAAESVRGSRRRKERQLSDFLEMSRWFWGDGQCGEEGVRALRREPAHELRRAGRVARLAEAEVGLEPEAVGRRVVDRNAAARREGDEAAALGLLGVDDGRPAAGDRDHEAAHARAERLAVVCAQQRPAGSAQEHGRRLRQDEGECLYNRWSRWSPGCTCHRRWPGRRWPAARSPRSCCPTRRYTGRNAAV